MISAEIGQLRTVPGFHKDVGWLHVAVVDPHGVKKSQGIQKLFEDLLTRFPIQGSLLALDSSYTHQGFLKVLNKKEETDPVGLKRVIMA
ncbi:hypothetical protein L596_009847 [Steinernema carpocapsae]|uniref:Uncharacterized protein n=1 Tax=Steinernema carpocapsae TaxID=34508 RepID=A0A4U5PGI4_STECR|nr:hypothetical protein L596_009847 [Steinernema carpocapsae]